jgi:hypothetical protein
MSSVSLQMPFRQVLPVRGSTTRRAGERFAAGYRQEAVKIQSRNRREPLRQRRSSLAGAVRGSSKEIMNRKRVLILCAANSARTARTRMAKGLMRH